MADPCVLHCVRTHLKEYLKTHPLAHWLEHRVPVKFEPFYSSIDLRDAGFKLAPVDANLYPAGFNNICSDDLASAVSILKPLLQRHLGQTPQRIAILPEFHTRNRFYADNLYELRQLFRNSGIETEIGWLSENINDTNPIQLQTSDERTLTAYPFTRKGDRLTFAPFDPEFILLNNDFSAGFPEILRGLKQPIEPSPKLGWHTRRKSDFFTHYNKLAGELATAAGIDPWRLQVATKQVTGIDFDEGKGLDQIADAVDAMLADLANEYKERNIEEKPFVFVKSNAGTYGMGVIRVESGNEIRTMNRRSRNKMAVGKNNLPIQEVIVQEGIPTRFQLDGVYGEPAMYLLGNELMGGFLRKNPERGRDDNLNSKGMVFQKLCISDLREGADRNLELELVYGTIAQLSAAAITLEIADVET